MIAAVAARACTDQRTARAVLDAFSDVVLETVQEKRECPLYGLGKLHVKRRADHVARDFSSGATLQIPAHDVPAFRASAMLSDLVSETGK